MRLFENSPGQNTGVGSLSLLQGIFPTQGSNPGLSHCRQILYQLSHKGSPLSRSLLKFMSIEYLTFLVPMQYCSLQHRTLVSASDTSPTEHRFCFVPTSSFFLKLLVIALRSSLVAYGTPSNLGAHLLVSYLSTLSYCSWGFSGKNTGVVCHSLLQ